MKSKQKEAFSKKIERKNTLLDCRPSSKFPTISITGENCELNCDYCQGRFLSGMSSIIDPQELLEYSIDLDSNGGRGILLSGGYNKKGYLPIEPFLGAISEIKDRTDLFVSVHSGLVSSDLARRLGESRVDAVYFDFLTDKYIIKDIIGLDRDGQDYIDSLEDLKEDIPFIAPHMLLGLSQSGLETEKKSLQALANYDIKSLVFLIIMPPKKDNTHYSIPLISEIRKFITKARLKFPKTDISLGCMRPRGEIGKNIEETAIKAGVDQIAMLSESARKTAREKGLEVERADACCAFPEKILGE